MSTWKQIGPANYHMINRDGSRYTIDRLVTKWMITYLPSGNAQDGREIVEWLPGRQSLNNAFASCEEHATVSSV